MRDGQDHALASVSVTMESETADQSNPCVRSTRFDRRDNKKPPEAGLLHFRTEKVFSQSQLLTDNRRHPKNETTGADDIGLPERNKKPASPPLTNFAPEQMWTIAEPITAAAMPDHDPHLERSS